MTITQKLFAVAIAVSAMMPLALLPNQAQAQENSQSQATARIEGFNVDEVRSLKPGTELSFELYGTPGGLATLRIDGAKRNLTMVETEAGLYEGTYTIGSRDKIVARSPVTANLRIGNQVTSTILSESLQVGVGDHSNRTTQNIQARIERFDVMPIADLNGGNDLQFTLIGTPGGKVDLTIDGVKGKIFLPEINKGEYVGAYTIKNRDRITPNSVVTANLRVGDRVSSVTLGKTLQTNAASLRNTRICNSCGTVETVNLVEVKGEGGYLGTIGGGVVGALLGSSHP